MYLNAWQASGTAGISQPESWAANVGDANPLFGEEEGSLTWTRPLWVQESSFYHARRLTQEVSQLLQSRSASTPSVSDGLVSSAILEMLQSPSQAAHLGQDSLSAAHTDLAGQDDAHANSAEQYNAGNPGAWQAGGAASVAALADNPADEASSFVHAWSSMLQKPSQASAACQTQPEAVPAGGTEVRCMAVLSASALHADLCLHAAQPWCE